MQMTDSEIKVNVLQAKDQRAQIRICAELNAVSEETIKEILKKEGVNLARLRGTRSKEAKNAKSGNPEIATFFANLYARVAELLKQKEEIDTELADINGQLNRIEDLIAGRE